MILKKFAGFFRSEDRKTDLGIINPSPRTINIGNRTKEIHPLVLRDWEEMVGDLTTALSKLGAKSPNTDVAALMNGDLAQAQTVLMPIYDEILSLVAKCLGETAETLRTEMTLVQLVRAVKTIIDINDLSEVMGNFLPLFLGKRNPKTPATAGGQR